MIIYESIYKSIKTCPKWSESDAQLGWNEISSAMYKYLQIVDQRKFYDTLGLYSVKFSGQNRAMIDVKLFFLANISCFRNTQTHTKKNTFVVWTYYEGYGPYSLYKSNFLFKSLFVRLPFNALKYRNKSRILPLHSKQNRENVSEIILFF